MEQNNEIFELRKLTIGKRTDRLSSGDKINTVALAFGKNFKDLYDIDTLFIKEVDDYFIVNDYNNGGQNIHLYKRGKSQYVLTLKKLIKLGVYIVVEGSYDNFIIRSANEEEKIEIQKKENKRRKTGYVSLTGLCIQSETKKYLGGDNLICKMHLSKTSTGSYLDIYNANNNEEYLSIPIWNDLRNENLYHLEEISDFEYRLPQNKNYFRLPISFQRKNDIRKGKQLKATLKDGHCYIDISSVYCEVCGKELLPSLGESYDYLASEKTVNQLRFIKDYNKIKNQTLTETNNDMKRILNALELAINKIVRETTIKE